MSASNEFRIECGSIGADSATGKPTFTVRISWCSACDVDQPSFQMWGPFLMWDPFHRAVNSSDVTSDEWNEETIRAYLEDYPDMPLRMSMEISALRVIERYGRCLFEQLEPLKNEPFSKIFAELKDNSDSLIKIIGGQQFQDLHWETLMQPNHPDPIALAIPLVREIPLNVPNNAGSARLLPVAADAELRIAIICPRPNSSASSENVRRYALQLVSLSRQYSQIPWKVQIICPGTLGALKRALGEPGARFHVLHFDGFSRVCGDTDATRRSVLCFEQSKEDSSGGDHSDDEIHDVCAAEFGNLISQFRIPIVIIDASNSKAMAAHLIANNASFVVGFSHSVLEDSSREFMLAFYEHLFRHPCNPGYAAMLARKSLRACDTKVANHENSIGLQDWFLPVVFVNSSKAFQSTSSNDTVQVDGNLQNPLDVGECSEHLSLVGRLPEFTEIDEQMLKCPQEGRNIFVIHGSVGIGKTALLKYLTWWWKSTEPSSAFYEIDFRTGIVRAAKIKKWLASDARRKVLILDHFEVVLNADGVGRCCLTAQDVKDFRELLTDLNSSAFSQADQCVTVLIGSRLHGASQEDMLWRVAPGGNALNLCHFDLNSSKELFLQQLDTTSGRGSWVRDPFLPRLIQALRGCPLSIKVAAAYWQLNKTESPETVLQHVRYGTLLKKMANTPLEDMVGRLREPYDQLDVVCQQFLRVLVPFYGLIVDPKDFLKKLSKANGQYGSYLEKCDEMLAQLQRRSLIRKGYSLNVMGYVFVEGSDRNDFDVWNIQPVTSCFLAAQVPDHDSTDRILEAFREHYAEISTKYWSLLQSQDTNKKNLGSRMIQSDLENLWKVLELHVTRLKGGFLSTFQCLLWYYDSRNEQTVSTELVMLVMQLFNSESGPLSHEVLPEVLCCYERQMCALIGVDRQEFEKYYESVQALVKERGAGIDALGVGELMHPFRLLKIENLRVFRDFKEVSLFEVEVVSIIGGKEGENPSKPRTLIAYLLTLVDAFLEEGRLEDAKLKLKEIEILQENNLQKDEERIFAVEVLCRKAQCAKLEGDSSSAADSFEQAIEKMKLFDCSDLSNVLLEYAAFLLLQNKYEEAEEALINSLNHAVKCNNIIGQYLSLANLSKLEGQRQNADGSRASLHAKKAVDYAQQALEMAENSDSPRFLGRAHAALGIRYANADEWPRSLICYQHACAIATNMDDKTLHSFIADLACLLAGPNSKDTCQRSLISDPDLLNQGLHSAERTQNDKAVRTLLQCRAAKELTAEQDRTYPHPSRFVWLSPFHLICACLLTNVVLFLLVLH
eukprot:ANDGO_07242.mRNA.1 hypothetical protein